MVDDERLPKHFRDREYQKFAADVEGKPGTVVLRRDGTPITDPLELLLIELVDETRKVRFLLEHMADLDLSDESID